MNRSFKTCCTDLRPKSQNCFLPLDLVPLCELMHLSSLMQCRQGTFKPFVVVLVTADTVRKQKQAFFFHFSDGGAKRKKK